MRIDKVYIISLETTDELISRCNNLQLPSPTSYWIKPGFDARTMSTSDWESLGVYKHPNWKIESNNRFWNREVTDGELGCSYSHVSVWNDARENDYNLIFLLEEDFFQVNPINWDEVEQLIDMGYDVIYLGRNGLHTDLEVPIEGFTNWVEPEYSYNTQSLVITKRGLDILIDEYSHQFKSEMFTIDEFFSVAFGKTDRTDILDGYLGKPLLKVAAPVINYIEQLNNKGLTEFNHV